MTADKTDKKPRVSKRTYYVCEANDLNAMLGGTGYKNYRDADRAIGKITEPGEYRIGCFWPPVTLAPPKDTPKLVRTVAEPASE